MCMIHTQLSIHWGGVQTESMNPITSNQRTAFILLKQIFDPEDNEAGHHQKPENPLNLRAPTVMTDIRWRKFHPRS